VIQTGQREAAEEFARRAAERFPEVQAVILYGSVARGDAREESDVDLMVIATRADEALKDRIFDLQLEVQNLFEHVLTQVVVDDVEEFRRCAMEGYPLERTVARQGIVLLDRGVFAPVRDALPPRVAEDTPEYRPYPNLIEEHMRAAEETLAAARILFENRLWNDCSNRAYYAMFNAGAAAVLATGVEEIRSHKALVDLFHHRVGVERGLGLQHANELQQAFQLRMNADYKPLFRVTEAAARDVLLKAERFLARVREFLA
jgi:uncharacterized protein (UPF0332 family)/predicted nucleotidyltransferase